MQHVDAVQQQERPQQSGADGVDGEGGDITRAADRTDKSADAGFRAGDEAAGSGAGGAGGEDRADLVMRPGCGRLAD
jgi:hypothetical protein